MNTTIKGKDLMVFVGGKSIALATSHTLEITANTADTTTKDNSGTWTDAEVTTMNWTLSSENLVSFGSDGKNTSDMIDLMLVGSKVTVVFGVASPMGADVPSGGFKPLSDSTAPIADYSDLTYSGSAIITSLSVTAQNGEKATYSVTFTGAGELKKITKEN